MAANIYTFVGIYDRALATVDHLLGKGSDFAASSGASDADMLGWRLAADMHPLAFQVGVVVNFARSFIARAAGAEVPAAIDAATLDLAQLRAAIADARAYLATVTPDMLEGREETPVTVKLGDVMEPTLPAAQWVTNFGLVNIEFHTSMVYAILRMKGAPLGKVDMFPAGL